MTVVRIGRHAAWLLGVGLAAWGCEPASVTEARDQLGQGPARSIEFSIPVLRDTINVADVLSDPVNIAADLANVNRRFNADLSTDSEGSTEFSADFELAVLESCVDASFNSDAGPRLAGCARTKGANFGANGTARSATCKRICSYRRTFFG